MTFAVWKPKYDIRQGDDPTVRAEAERPVVAYLPNGGYVVAWSEGDNQLKLKIYNGAGDTNGTVYSVDAASARGMNIDIQPIGTNGNFAVGWNSGTTGSATLKVRVFTHNNDGTYTGGTITDVQSNTTGSSEIPSLSARTGGGFTSTYTNGSNVFLRLHEADGSTSRTVQMLDENASSIDYPRATEIAPNKFVVSYGMGDNIFAQIVTINGNTISKQSLGHAQTGLGSGDKSQVVALKDADGNADGRFAVVQYRNQNLVAKFYDQNGARIGDVNNEVVIATNVWPFENFFDVTAIRGGRIAVTYSELSQSIALKVLDIQGSSGNPNNDPLIVGPIGHRQPTISEMADGRLAVAYEDWTSGNFIDTTGVIVDPRLAKVKVEGTAQKDYYVGSEHDGDELRGNGGNDTLIGGKGGDHLNGGKDADRLDGGDGQDTASYWDADAAVGVYLHGQRANTGDAAGDTYTRIEVIAGSAHDDTIEGAVGNDIFFGAGGDDMLRGFGGDDALSGAEGSDTLYGGLGADTFDGGFDDDRDVVTYEFSTTGGVVADLSTPSRNAGEAAGDTYNGTIDDLVGTNWGRCSHRVG
ncbi:MAG: calcium-binding protein [Microvirga sp.]